MPPKRRGAPKASTSSRKSSRKTSPGNPVAAAPADNPLAPGSYQEPPVLDRPSYEEYAGAPRFNVLDDMQPLGTLPSNGVKLRAKKARAGAAKERVERAESSQPMATSQSTDPFHPMVTRGRTQSHIAKGTRSASRVPPPKPTSRRRPAALRKAQDTIAPRTRSVSRNPQALIPITRRSGSRKPQDSIPITRRSGSEKLQDPTPTLRRSESPKPHDPIPDNRRSESCHPPGPHRRSQSRKVENRVLNTHRSQSRKLEDRIPSTRRARSRKLEDQIPQETSSHEGKDDQEDMPKAIAENSSSTAAVPPSADAGPSSRSAASQSYLKQVVDAAVQRSIDLGNPVIGLAVKKLYEESLDSQKLADLLDGVLSQHPTPQQTTDFQAFIKVARKQIKAETGSARHSSQSTRPSSSRRAGAPKDSMDASGKNKLLSTADNSSLPQDTTTTTKHTSSKEEIPPKRKKTSRSVSTSSSLSSLPSIEHELSPVEKGDQAIVSQPTKNLLALDQPLLRTKRKMVSATNQSLEPPTRPIVGQSDAEELAIKAKYVKGRTFPDFKHLDSDIRDPPRPWKPSKISPVKPKPAFTLTQPRPPIATSRKRKHDDEDSCHSPTSSHGELLIPPPPGARATSRGITPNPTGRPAKRIKAARVKMSPVKKKSGVTGTARTGGRKGAKLDHAEEIQIDNNEDACTACGGNGKLLCCDNCPSAFHFSCVDPPLDEHNPPEGEWLCNKCENKRAPPAKKPSGLFSGLMGNIEKRNPSTFSLPQDLRDQYEGVKTGSKGEYQEFTDVGIKVKAKSQDEAKAEALKLKDKAGKTILCYHCHGSALGGRPIISCDYCSLKWHLDCLDPPRANIPIKQPSGNPRHTWMCPNHADHELRAIDTSIRATGEPNPAGKFLRLRKPKNPQYIEPALSRGVRNNGQIDIINEPSDEEVETSNQGRVIYRLTEKSIKLDFIDKMKKTREEQIRKQQMERAAANEAFNQHSFIDRQAALNLAHFARSNEDLGLSPANVEELTNALIAEAPENVASLIAREERSTRLSTIPEEESTDSPVGLAPSSQLAEKSTGGTEKQALELLQELIRRRLEAMASSR